MLASPLLVGMIGRGGSADKAAESQRKLKNMPPLIGGPESWMNTGGKSLDARTGVVYLIDFWDYTCVNCIRTLPYVREWHDRYKDKGLVVVGIHTPEFGFAKKHEVVQEAVDMFAIDYPVLLDPDYENWNVYANRYWPHKFLVGPDGKIIYDHAGEGAYGETEAMIQQALREINPTVKLPKPMTPATGANKPGAVCYPMTPELYVGYRRGNMGSPEGYRDDEIVDYTDPGGHIDGKIYASGLFYNDAECLRHADKTVQPEDYIAIRYHALDVNAVMRPEGGEYEVIVTQDGHPLDPADAGPDVFLAEGQSRITVDQPRMYKIVENREFGTHELKLSSNSDSFAIYAFTFGSCEEAD